MEWFAILEREYGEARESVQGSSSGSFYRDVLSRFGNLKFKDGILSRMLVYGVYIYMFSLVEWFRDTEEEWDF